MYFVVNIHINNQSTLYKVNGVVKNPFCFQKNEVVTVEQKRNCEWWWKSYQSQIDH
jgi:hypothetical protein